MGKKRFFRTLLFSLVITLFLFGCSDSADFFGGGDYFSIRIASTENGEILSSTAVSESRSISAGSLSNPGYMFFRIWGKEEYNEELKLAIDLYNAFGEQIAHKEKISPDINVDLPVEIPVLDAGQYELVLTLFQYEKLISEERRVFFSTDKEMEIQGIQSFPLVIFPRDTILLIADIPDNIPTEKNNLFFRWTYKKKIIARGTLRDGYDQILWEAPNEDGVYTVRVDVFPFAPAVGNDYLFDSPYAVTADLFISPRKEGYKEDQKKSDFYYDLFSIYVSALKEREKQSQEERARLRRPVPVIIGETIGMKFNGQAGFVCPELIFPVFDDQIDPFTVRLGITLEGKQTGKQILSLLTKDAEFSLDFFFDAKNELVLRLKVKDREYFFPSTIKKLEEDQRYLVEFSLIQKGNVMQAVWKLDGNDVITVENPFSYTKGDKKGYTVIGGENGIKGIIDTLDVILIEK